MSAMRFGLAISQEGPEPQSLGAIESILLIGCLHKMRSHLAEDPSFQSLTRKIHGSSMDFPSERGVPLLEPILGHGRRSLDLQCLDGSFCGALQLSVCVTWINDLANVRCAHFWGLENWTLTPNWPPNPHISMRKNDDHPWVYGIAGILVEAFPLRCSNLFDMFHVPRGESQSKNQLRIVYDATCQVAGCPKIRVPSSHHGFQCWNGLTLMILGGTSILGNLHTYTYIHIIIYTHTIYIYYVCVCVSSFVYKLTRTFKQSPPPETAASVAVQDDNQTHRFHRSYSPGIKSMAISGT